MDYTKLRDTDKVTILQKDLESTNNSLDDLLFEKFGSNRKTEILGKIGDKGQGYEKTLTDYLLSL